MITEIQFSNWDGVNAIAFIKRKQERRRFVCSITMSSTPDLYSSTYEKFQKISVILRKTMCNERICSLSCTNVRNTNAVAFTSIITLLSFLMCPLEGAFCVNL